MTSFIELPRVGFRGIEQESLYVNVDDIVAFQREYDGQTAVTLRDFGSEGHGTVRTYVPVGALHNMLTDLAQRPRAVAWADNVLEGWRVPLVALLQQQADREREAYARVGG